LASSRRLDNGNGTLIGRHIGVYHNFYSIRGLDFFHNLLGKINFEVKLLDLVLNEFLNPFFLFFVKVNHFIKVTFTILTLFVAVSGGQHFWFILFLNPAFGGGVRSKFRKNGYKIYMTII